MGELTTAFVAERSWESALADDSCVADALVRRSAVSEAKAITSVMRAFRAQSGTRGVAGELRVRPRRKVWGWSYMPTRAWLPHA